MDMATALGNIYTGEENQYHPGKTISLSIGSLVAKSAHSYDHASWLLVPLHLIVLHPPPITRGAYCVGAH